MKAVRTDTAAPGMESLTNCKVNRTRVEMKVVRTASATHEITHFL